MLMVIKTKLKDFKLPSEWCILLSGLLDAAKKKPTSFSQKFVFSDQRTDEFDVFP